MLNILDVLGTFAFALSGAFRAVRYELDLLGVITLGIATGVGGGILRDLLLGITPPLVLVQQSYIGICVLGAVLVFFAAPKIARRWDAVLAADAIGLAVFTVIGASRAEALGAVPLTVMLMGVLTAVGGGVVRDLLVNEIPAVLSHDFYASAALLGAFTYLLLGWLACPEPARVAIAIGLTLALRIVAMRYALALPRVRALPASPSELTRQRKSGRRPPP